MQKKEEYKYRKHRKNRYNRKHGENVKERIDKVKWLNSIKELIHQNKHSKALSEVEHYLDSYPNDSYGMFQKAIILSNLDRLEEAEEIYTYIIDNELESKYSSLYKMGLLEETKGNKEKAEEYYRRNIETSPYPEIYTRVELARIESTKGNFENANKLLDGYYDRKVNGLDEVCVLSKDIGIEELNKMLVEKAIIKYLLNDNESAKEILENVVLGENRIVEREYWLLKGKIARREKNNELAMSYCQKAMDGPIGEVYWKAKLEIANIKNRSGEPEAAIELCNSIINNSIEKSGVWFLAHISRGDAYFNLGDIDKAREEYLKCNYNNYSEGYYSLGKMEFTLKNYEMALECFKKYKGETFVNNNECKFYEMLSFLKLKKYEKAYSICKKVIKHLMTDVKQREYYYASIYLKNKLGIPQYSERFDSYMHSQILNYNYEEAIKHIKRVHEKDNEEVEFNEDVDIEELILTLSEILKRDDVVIRQNLFLETYDIPYENLGKQNGVSTNMLKVVMLPEENKVITMFPVIKKMKQKEKNMEKVKIIK